MELGDSSAQIHEDFEVKASLAIAHAPLDLGLVR
jgi:hypothetical protein